MLAKWYPRFYVIWHLPSHLSPASSHKAMHALVPGVFALTALSMQKILESDCLRSLHAVGLSSSSVCPDRLSCTLLLQCPCSWWHSLPQALFHCLLCFVDGISFLPLWIVRSVFVCMLGGLLLYHLLFSTLSLNLSFQRITASWSSLSFLP